MTRAREISNVLGRNIESTTFTATAGQTAFSITHAAGRIQVYMNGLLLDPTVDWTSDGSTVTLTEGAVVGDELEVVKFDNLAVADAIPRTGHTGTIDFSDATFTPPAGHVVQTKIAEELNSQSTTSTTFQDVLTVDFTPKYNNSILLISGVVNGISYEGGSSYKGSRWQYVVTPSGGSVTADYINYYMFHEPTGSRYGGQVPFTIKYTVSSTVSHSIKIQARSFDGSSNYLRNRNGERSTISVQEIAG